MKHGNSMLFLCFGEHVEILRMSLNIFFETVESHFSFEAILL